MDTDEKTDLDGAAGWRRSPAKLWAATRLLCVLTFVSLLSGGCNRAPTPAPTPAPVVAAAAAPPSQPETPAAEATPPAPAGLAPLPTTPPALLTPNRLRGRAPARFRVKFTTTKGTFTVQVVRAWAPRGADRFYNLVKAGFYQGNRVHRVVSRTLVQFGVHGDPAVNHAWYPATIPDEVRRKPNLRGSVALVGAGIDERRTELLISLRKNPGLDMQNVAPLGQVIQGMKVVESLRSTDRPNRLPLDKAALLMEGEAYAAAAHPNLAKLTAVALLR